jgi:hypothetical protein
VTTLRTAVAEDNPSSLAMLRRLGPTTVTGEGTGRLEVLVDLPPVAAAAQPTVDTVG